MGKYVVCATVVVEAQNEQEAESLVRSGVEIAPGIERVRIDKTGLLPQQLTIGTDDNAFVIFSVAEWMECNDGFWSNEYGWVDINLATRFKLVDLVNFELPISKNDDAFWVSDPVANFTYPFVMKVKPRHSHDSDPWIDHCCFAKNKDDAVMQTQCQFPGARIVAMVDIAKRMGEAQAHPFDRDDYAENPEKYKLFKVAQINMTLDHNIAPFLPGDVVSIDFSGDRGGTPLYCIAHHPNDFLANKGIIVLFGTALSNFLL